MEEQSGGDKMSGNISPLQLTFGHRWQKGPHKNAPHPIYPHVIGSCPSPNHVLRSILGQWGRRQKKTGFVGKLSYKADVLAFPKPYFACAAQP